VRGVSRPRGEDLRLERCDRAKDTKVAKGRPPQLIKLRGRGHPSGWRDATEGDFRPGAVEEAADLQSPTASRTERRRQRSR